MILYSAFKYIYYCLPLKKQFFSLIKLFYSPSKKNALYLKFKGRIKVKIGGHYYKIFNNNTAIETLLFWKGIDSHEYFSLKTWGILSENKKIILDIGANSGIYSIVAHEFASTDVKIYGFEPLPRIAYFYKLNMNLNNINAQINEVAISNKNSRLSFFDMEGFDNQIGSLDIEHVKKHKHHTKIKEIKVNTTTIDSFVQKNQLKTIDLIKIDVEGVEDKALEGMKQTIIYSSPAIIVEISNNLTAEKINAFFDSFTHPYVFFEINDSIGLFQKQKISKTNAFNYLICTKNHIPLIKSLIRD